MRKAHDGRFAGAGTAWAYRDDSETYKDIKVDVMLPYDFMTTEQRKNLNGPVKTYFIEVDDNV